MIDRIKEKIKTTFMTLKNNSGLSVVEMILILVVIIALVLIFKQQLMDLVNKIFKKITTESMKV